MRNLEDNTTSLIFFPYFVRYAEVFIIILLKFINYG